MGFLCRFVLFLFSPPVADSDRQFVLRRKKTTGYVQDASEVNKVTNTKVA